MNASSARLHSRVGNVSGDFCLFAFKAIASRLVGAGSAEDEGVLWRPPVADGQRDAGALV